MDHESSPATLTTDQAKSLVASWAWEQMSSADRIAASTKILDARGVPRVERHMLGITTWGPANPGGLGRKSRTALYAWVRREMDAHDIQGNWPARSVGESAGLSPDAMSRLAEAAGWCLGDDLTPGETDLGAT